MREAPAAPLAAATGAASAAAEAALSDTARADYSRQPYEAAKERDEFERHVQDLRRKSQVGVAPKEDYQAAQQRCERATERTQELRQMLDQARQDRPRASMGNRGIMDSTFSIAVGETVVIGTSRLKGEKALIALLTAATKPTPSR